MADCTHPASEPKAAALSYAAVRQLSEWSSPSDTNSVARVIGRSWPGAEIGFPKANGRYRCVADGGADECHFCSGSKAVITDQTPPQ